MSAVVASWQKVLDRNTDVAGTFYANLFERQPELRAMFPADLREQKSKLLQMLNQVVLSLHALDALLPAVRTLGARHAYYRVQGHHYAVVGQALIATLRVSLGNEFTPELEHAWRESYDVLARTMIAAAEIARNPLS